MPTHVILLPGFLGINLVDRTGVTLWLDPATVVAGQVDIAARLALDPSGERDAIPGLDVHPGQPIGFIYEPLSEALTRAGFALHTFVFDYRKSLLAAAGELRAFVAREVPGERFWFVGHSIGGPLAALYPYLDASAALPEVDPSWQAQVAGVICHGGTMLGTLEPVEALTGAHWFLAVVGLGQADREDALRRSLSTWPGLMCLLPDPVGFPDVARLYQEEAWPEGYRPRQRHLDGARVVKDLVRQSPLWSAPDHVPVVQFAASSYHTAGALGPAAMPLALAPRVAPGDDTVPLFAATPAPGVRVLHAGFPHTFMPTDPDVIQATIDLIRTGHCEAPVLVPVGPDATLPGEPLPPPIAMLLGMSSTVLHDLVGGRQRLADVVGLLRDLAG